MPATPDNPGSFCRQKVLFSRRAWRRIRAMKKSASLLIQNPKSQYLLIRRSNTCKHFIGCWEFPGGKRDGDEPPHTALVREVREEISLDLPVPLGNPMRYLTSSDRSVEYAFFKWECPTDALDIQLSEEHSEFRWATFTEARKLALVQIHRDFLEWQWLHNQIHVYETQEHPRYEQYEKTLRAVLERLKDRWSPLAIVQARAKGLSSFAEKCLRKADKHDDPVHQLTDLCGGRIVTPTTDEAEIICRQIRKLFHPVDEEDDTRTRHGIAAFGYLSVHFLVHFPKGMKKMLGVPVPPEITDLKAEVQIRTLLQHAHSEVTHDRLYKAGYKPPPHCEREAARVAAALETADQEFTRFVHQLDAYVGNYAAHLPREERQRRLADLRLALEAERKPEKKPVIALHMARFCRAAWDWPCIVEALEPFAATAGPEQLCINLELGNALCRLHRDQPTWRGFLRGLEFLESVAQPEAVTDVFTEADERERRATALAWLGSALSKVEGKRTEARNCLAKAVELSPDNPYHLVAFVELDVIASSTVDHITLLVSALRQAAERCEAHIRAGIEVTRAWLTLAKVRLLLAEETGAVEALCVAARIAENHHPLTDFQRSLDRLKDAIGTHRPFIEMLDRAAMLLTKAQEFKDETEHRAGLDWEPLARRFVYPPDGHFLILAGSTAAGSETQLAAWEQPLEQALQKFEGWMLTGGSSAGVCAMAARVVDKLNRPQPGRINLVGYLPAQAKANPSFPPKQIVRTPNTREFSLLDPVQMWVDLLLSGVKVEPANVTLLCFGGGEISAQELALAWASGARAAVLAGDCFAPRQFAKLLASAGETRPGGMVVPADAATLAMLFRVQKQNGDRAWDQKWEKPGQAVHEDYVRHQREQAKQPTLLPWELVNEGFKHSNRHQAACAVEILEQCGFKVERSTLPADQIPLPDLGNQVERMAEMEHGRWNAERLSNGWGYAKDKDQARKLSPYLVAWNDLPEEIKSYDRNAVRAWPRILAQAGLVVKREA